MNRGKIFAGSSSRQFVLVIENVGTSLQFSGMRQPPAMLELRPNIFAVNPAPTNFAANEIGFVGRLEFRGSAHGVTTRNFGHTG